MTKPPVSIRRLLRLLNRVFLGVWTAPRRLRWKILLSRNPDRLITCHLGRRARIEVCARDVIGQQIYVHRRFEYAETRYWCRTLSPGMVVIDAGASIGWYSVLAIDRVGETGEIHAFEPTPDSADRLEHNIHRSGGDDICRVNRSALWSISESKRMLSYEPGAEVYNSFGSHVREATVTSAITVPTTTLDQYAAALRIDSIDFLKLDVEGAELHVFAGSSALLGEHRIARIMFEATQINSSGFGYEPRAIWSMLASYKYEIFELTERGALLPCMGPRPSYWRQNWVALRPA